MGEIADMMLDGTLDFYTGEYIGRGKGMPRTLDNSLPWERNQKRSEDLRCKEVESFLNSAGIKQHLHPQVVKDYGCRYSGKNPFRNACFEVLKTFDKFKSFVAEWKIKNL